MTHYIPSPNEPSPFGPELNELKVFSDNPWIVWVCKEKTNFGSNKPFIMIGDMKHEGSGCELREFLIDHLNNEQKRTHFELNEIDFSRRTKDGYPSLSWVIHHAYAMGISFEQAHQRAINAVLKEQKHNQSN